MAKRVKVVLTESITSLGRDGDVVEVAPGYARNFLLPFGKAANVTPSICLLYTSPSPRDGLLSRMPSSA